jgi:hypothetical protein
MTQPTAPTLADYTHQARHLLARLAGGNRRDRIAFAYGYVLAFDAMAAVLPADELTHHRNVAIALHHQATEEPR